MKLSQVGMACVHENLESQEKSLEDVGMQWKDKNLIINKPTKPLENCTFDITCKQVKSHSRHLEGLQELNFYSDEGK
jgi:hypothetical protein